MPNLDKVFNKFFPQSQTGSKGKFLLKMAWTVEILVALIGICIAIIVVMQAQGTKDLDDLSGRALNLSDLTFGGIFFIVAIVELTKIPLATAVYYSVRIYWKVIFLIGLLMVNVSTFETIVTGFERINRERTKVIDKKIVKYHSVSTQIEQLKDNTTVKSVDGDINELRNQRTKINGQISEINLNGKIKIQEIKNSSSNKNEIDRLKNQIDKIDKNIDSLRGDNTNLSSQKDSKVFGSNKKGIDSQIAKNDLIIQDYKKDKAIKENELKNLINKDGKNINGEIESVDSSLTHTTEAHNPAHNSLSILSRLTHLRLVK